MSAFVGIHEGENASVAVVRDGWAEFALQGDHITRIKNQGDAPSGTAKLALKMLPGDGRGSRMALRDWWVERA